MLRILTALRCLVDPAERSRQRIYRAERVLGLTPADIDFVVEHRR